eukprot:13658439-Alexandrium_andersonii.AAC.1
MCIVLLWLHARYRHGGSPARTRTGWTALQPCSTHVMARARGYLRHTCSPQLFICCATSSLAHALRRVLGADQSR